MNSIAPSHGQLLANTVGHGAGVLLFGIALWLLMRRRGGRAGVWAAWLALIWNLASLVSLGLGNEVRMGKAAADSLAFAALSLLPAVLLELSVGGAFRVATRLGYAVSTLAAVLHATELVVEQSGIHRTGLWMVTAGFASLTLYCFARTGRSVQLCLQLRIPSMFQQTMVESGRQQTADCLNTVLGVLSVMKAISSPWDATECFSPETTGRVGTK